MMTKRLAAAVLSLAVAVPAATAAYAWDEDLERSYFSHSDTITRGAGDANATNAVTQTIDPWARHSRNTKIQMDGKRAQIGITRYQENKSIQPKGLSGLGNGNGANGGASTTK